jgi:hypothetical protein
MFLVNSELYIRNTIEFSFMVIKFYCGVNCLFTIRRHVRANRRRSLFDRENVTHHSALPGNLVGSTAMPNLPKILNNHCPAPPMGDIAVSGPDPAETTRPVPEIVNAVHARFRGGGALTTGAGGTSCRRG